MVCQGCGADLGKRERVGRRDSCPRCGMDLHSCVNCTFYEPGAYNDCREPNAERVLDKKRSNFCEYFSAATGTTGISRHRPGSARDELDKLFGSPKRKS